MTDRDQIFGRLAAGVGAPKLELPSSRTEPADLDTFLTRWKDLGGEVAAELDLSWQSLATVIDTDVPPPVSQWFRMKSSDVWSAEIGVTTADALVSETGSVLICSQGGRRRLASLAPPVHLVVAQPSQIVGSLADAFGRFPDGNLVLISGPSRTADIEGVLVRGVHGPGRVILLLTD